MSNVVIKLNDAAEAEFYDTVEYYKQFDQALYYDFIQEFENAVQQLMKFPRAGHPYLHQTKRIFLNRFPYAIVYKVYNDPDEVFEGLRSELIDRLNAVVTR